MAINLQKGEPSPQLYFVDYTKELVEFLNIRGISHITSDVDIVCISIWRAYSDNEFALLMADFGRWLEQNKNDMTINPNGDGSQYHLN